MNENKPTYTQQLDSLHSILTTLLRLYPELDSTYNPTYHDANVYIDKFIKQNRILNEEKDKHVGLD